MAMLHRNAGVWRPNVPCGPKKWAKWNEQSELGLACDDIFVAMMENPSAAGNEIGQGGGIQNVPDRTLTQVGNIAGAVGSPPYRSFVGGGVEGYYLPSAVINLLKENTEWTVIIKWRDFRSVAGAIAYMSFFELYPGAGGFRSDTFSTAVTTAGFPTSGDLWVVLWSNGSTVRGGFTSTKPTKSSDFASNKVLNYGNKCDLSAKTIRPEFGWDHTGVGAQGQSWGGKAMYLIISRVNLITD